MQPSTRPSTQPSTQPTEQPSTTPTMQPSAVPTSAPLVRPSAQPSVAPSAQPSALPSTQPTTTPTTDPTSEPSAAPTAPSGKPSSQPSSVPSHQPQGAPTTQPSARPSAAPNSVPSSQPSRRPSVRPSDEPTIQPNSVPSGQPTTRPSSQPSAVPFPAPTPVPSTAAPSTAPSFRVHDILQYSATLTVANVSSCNLTEAEDLAVRTAYVKALNSTVKLSDVAVNIVTCDGQVIASRRQLAKSRSFTASYELGVVLNLVDYPAVGNNATLLLNIITKQTTNFVFSAAFNKELRASATEFGSLLLLNCVVEGASTEFLSVTPVSESPTAAPVQSDGPGQLSASGLARDVFRAEWYYLLLLAIFLSASFSAVGYYYASVLKEVADDSDLRQATSVESMVDWVAPELTGDTDADLDHFFADLMDLPRSSDAPGEGGGGGKSAYSWDKDSSDLSSAFSSHQPHEGDSSSDDEEYKGDVVELWPDFASKEAGEFRTTQAPARRKKSSSTEAPAGNPDAALEAGELGAIYSRPDSRTRAVSKPETSALRISSLARRKSVGALSTPSGSAEDLRARACPEARKDSPIVVRLKSIFVAAPSPPPPPVPSASLANPLRRRDRPRWLSADGSISAASAAIAAETTAAVDSSPTPRRKKSVVFMDTTGAP